MEEQKGSFSDVIVRMVERTPALMAYRRLIFALLRLNIEDKAIREKRNKLLRTSRNRLLLPFLYGFAGKQQDALSVTTKIAVGSVGICLGRKFYDDIFAR